MIPPFPYPPPNHLPAYPDTLTSCRVYRWHAPAALRCTSSPLAVGWPVYPHSSPSPLNTHTHSPRGPQKRPQGKAPVSPQRRGAAAVHWALARQLRAQRRLQAQHRERARSRPLVRRQPSMVHHRCRPYSDDIPHNIILALLALMLQLFPLFTNHAGFTCLYAATEAVVAAVGS